MKHFVFVLAIFGSTAFGQMSSVVNSRHNLSVSGPGSIRAVSEQEVCIFCHTPHNASAIQPLWNRNVPVNAYTVYTSNSLKARPGQPTGTSKLCLSCHDGTIALGSVLSRNQPIQMVGGMTTLPPGHRANLGTDLSDDHPISFRYDTDLLGKNPKLKSPMGLPPGVRLDGNQELQCTTCHEPHNNRFGNFLVMDNSNSKLCASCHNQGLTDLPSHESCNACHKTHTAPSGPYLLTRQTVTETCTTCHSNQPGPTQGKDILSDILKTARHDNRPPVNQKDHVPNNTTCNDCHEPHTMMGATAAAPNISPKLGRIDGINSAGAVVPAAQFQYEVCFKCHADQFATKPRLVSRQIVQMNKRLQFDPTAISFHPIEQPGKATEVPSLKPGLTTASIMYCADCHSSDTSKVAGAAGPDGPHGSNHPGLLIAAYATADMTPENANTYALCYRCHERASILANQSFSEHNRHIVTQQTPCSVCHDSHGIASAQGNPTNNSNLINFDTTIVQPDPVSKRLEYRTLGNRTGECFLSCHGVPHSPKAYPAAGFIAPAAIKAQRAPIPLQQPLKRSRIIGDK